VSGSAHYGSSKNPSAWAIVLVAALLILLPATFCGIVLYTSSTGPQGTHEEMKFKPGGGGGGGP
jgi:hypothetical protein